MIMKSNFEKLTYFWHVTVDNTYWSIEIIRILRNSKLNGPLVDIMINWNEQSLTTSKLNGPLVDFNVIQ